MAKLTQEQRQIAFAEIDKFKSERDFMPKTVREAMVGNFGKNNYAGLIRFDKEYDKIRISFYDAETHKSTEFKVITFGGSGTAAYSNFDKALAAAKSAAKSYVARM